MVLVLVFDRGSSDRDGKDDEAYVVSFEDRERAEAFRRIFNTARDIHTGFVGGYPSWAQIVDRSKVPSGEEIAAGEADYLADFWSEEGPPVEFQDWAEIAERCPAW